MIKLSAGGKVFHLRAPSDENPPNHGIRLEVYSVVTEKVEKVISEHKKLACGVRDGIEIPLPRE
jgi:hypothetical protein